MIEWYGFNKNEEATRRLKWKSRERKKLHDLRLIWVCDLCRYGILRMTKLQSILYPYMNMTWTWTHSQTLHSCSTHTQFCVVHCTRRTKHDDTTTSISPERINMRLCTSRKQLAYLLFAFILSGIFRLFCCCCCCLLLPFRSSFVRFTLTVVYCVAVELYVRFGIQI